jgi:hypothetical protein
MGVRKYLEQSPLNSISRFIGIALVAVCMTACQSKIESQKPQSPDESIAKLSIGYDAMLKFDRKMQAGKKRGYMVAEDTDWVRAKLVVDGDTLFINIRPKGDDVNGPIDSLLSFRVKVAKKASFKGMRSLSIHPASNKAYGEEWLAHELLRNEDILTPRYGFFPLEVNGQSWGMYAWEEHFDKQLVESSKRREGPILKLDESVILEIHADGDLKEVLVDRAEIQPFGSGKIGRSEVLKAQFIDAQRLMRQLRLNEAPASDIYDVKKLATVYALVDLMGSSTCLEWDNQRCYFNPVNARLEPVVYNCFNDSERAKSELLGVKYASSSTLKYADIPFLDSLFVAEYVAALQRITADDYLEQIFEGTELPFAEGLKKQHDYKLDYKAWIARRDVIRDQLAGLSTKIIGAQNQKMLAIDIQFPWQPLPSLSIKAYVQETALNGVHTMLLLNAFDKPIEVLGFGTKVSMCYGFDEPVIVDPSLEPSQGKVVSSRGKFCYYRVLGLGEIHKRAIVKWPFPEGISTRQLYASNHSIPVEFVQEGKRLTLQKGSYTFSDNIYIPAGLEIHIDAGAAVTLNGCGWMSLSPIFVHGTEEAPVVFKGKEATGFTIMNGHLRSSLSYCTFDGFGTQELPGWLLTGAVNFYESDVDMDHCHMLNNTCEDGLNIIRSDFKLEACEIAHTFGDGFDADYCTGEIANSSVHHTDNDCLDFSTSIISVVNCQIFDSGDKAVSAGENSTITVKGTQISRAHIGLASKDQSLLDVSESSMDACHFGYTIYQKKPEYGPARIEAVSVQISAIDTLQLIELGSVLILDGKEIKGNQTIDLAKMYGL